MNTQESTSDGSSTRTSTPGNEGQILDVISNREDLKSFLANYGVTADDFYKEVREDLVIVRDIMTEPELSVNVMKRIEGKLEEFQARKQIETAKSSMEEKIRQRMEMLQKRLDGNNENL
eukprot:CAMPEP_0202947746 /NCGR_PEP_ID=MMETSP1395-20130829/12095_1 /ASSEMBLY_ACC=CAM_ASM_000871 /TAXON_ID=5961 /ORGANISM="Blepharisma japonicum, Strain Stock R1072" /LENGTH=118 /DNA_ID=CAMNT_0049649235 /DNA_START=48 /DNA_END=404 /DNA_ORIENTATION=+